jgi:hypothetical protein
LALTPPQYAAFQIMTSPKFPHSSLESARDTLGEVLDEVRTIPFDWNSPGIEDFDAQTNWTGARLQDIIATLNWSLN